MAVFVPLSTDEVQSAIPAKLFGLVVMIMLEWLRLTRGRVLEVQLEVFLAKSSLWVETCDSHFLQVHLQQNQSYDPVYSYVN